MRFLKLSAFLIMILSVVVSCQKEVSENDSEDPAPSGQLIRIHQGQDPLTDDDTVWLVSYDPTEKSTRL